MALARCAPEPPPPSDPDLRTELGIPDQIPIHRIGFVALGDRIRLLPIETRIQPGDIVQFVALDNRVYAVRFDLEKLENDPRRFLEETGQDQPPPLVERDARLVITFEGAPEAMYSFSVDGSGTIASGVISVERGLGR